jgi:hypothetical protein
MSHNPYLKKPISFHHGITIEEKPGKFEEALNERKEHVRRNG